MVVAQIVFSEVLCVFSRWGDLHDRRQSSRDDGGILALVDEENTSMRTDQARTHGKFKTMNIL